MSIYLKLLEFQKKNIVIKKDAVGHHQNKYATLNEVLEKVKGPLNELGIVIVQRPTVADGQAGLQTILVDTEEKEESAASVACFMPYVGASDAQKLGSANTYNRRYSLVTLLGLEDEDDDGNTASAPSRPAQRRTEAPKGVVERDDVPFEGDQFKPRETTAYDGSSSEFVDLEEIKFD